MSTWIVIYDLHKHGIAKLGCMRGLYFITAPSYDDVIDVLKDIKLKSTLPQNRASPGSEPRFVDLFANDGALCADVQIDPFPLIEIESPTLRLTAYS